MFKEEESEGTRYGRSGTTHPRTSVQDLEEEGRPEGRAEVHWDMARELIACHALAWRCKAAPVSLSATNGAQTPVVLVPRLARMALA